MNAFIVIVLITFTPLIYLASVYFKREMAKAQDRKQENPSNLQVIYGAFSLMLGLFIGVPLFILGILITISPGNLGGILGPPMAVFGFICLLCFKAAFYYLKPSVRTLKIIMVASSIIAFSMIGLGIQNVAETKKIDEAYYQKQ